MHPLDSNDDSSSNPERGLRGVSPLTRSALQKHKEKHWPDGLEKLAESIAREETTQLFHRVLGDRRGLDVYGGVRAGHIVAHTDTPLITNDANADLEQITRLYPKRPQCSPTPMQRYSMPGSVEDPFPMYARQEMAKSGVHYASLETLQLRAEAARLAAGDAETPTTSTQLAETCSGTQPAPTAGPARVYKEVLALKRLDSSSDAMAKKRRKLE